MASATKVAQLYTTRAITALGGRARATATANSAKTTERPSLVLRSALTRTVNGEQVDVTYTFAISPNEINLQRLGIAYGELERPGRKPLLQSRNEQLRQLSATVMVTANGDDKFYGSCQLQIDGLIALANIDADVFVHYPGVPQVMAWRITDLSIRTVRRDDMNNVTIAEAEITFTEATSPQTVVPGMKTIKDTQIGDPVRVKHPSGGSGSGSTGCQRNGADRDADTKCRVDDVVAAGP
jgi:hypothetical protein